MYEYKALVTRVVDGDTIDAEIDLGFGMYSRQRLRLYGINTPETRTRDLEEKEAGLEAKKVVTDTILGKRVTIRTEKAGKFGRYLVEVILENGTNLNNYLVENGYAVEYMKD